MIGTRISRTFTVAFFRRTISAETSTSAMVVYKGGMEKALLKAEVTELPTTWLMPHQQIRPETANRDASTLFFSGVFRLDRIQSWI